MVECNSFVVVFKVLSVIPLLLLLLPITTQYLEITHSLYECLFQFRKLYLLTMDIVRNAGRNANTRAQFHLVSSAMAERTLH